MVKNAQLIALNLMDLSMNYEISLFSESSSHFNVHVIFNYLRLTWSILH